MDEKTNKFIRTRQNMLTIVEIIQKARPVSMSKDEIRQEFQKITGEELSRNALTYILTRNPEIFKSVRKGEYIVRVKHGGIQEHEQIDHISSFSANQINEIPVEQASKVIKTRQNMLTVMGIIQKQSPVSMSKDEIQQEFRKITGEELSRNALTYILTRNPENFQSVRKGEYILRVENDNIHVDQQIDEQTCKVIRTRQNMLTIMEIIQNSNPVSMNKDEIRQKFQKITGEKLSKNALTYILTRNPEVFQSVRKGEYRMRGDSRFNQIN